MVSALRLRDLQASFLRLDRTADRTLYHRVESIDEAQGVIFLCPKCFKANGGSVGTHMIICWSRSRGVPDDEPPGPGRWYLGGRSLDDLILDGEGGQPRSIQLTSDCGWHGYVTHGEITDA